MQNDCTLCMRFSPLARVYEELISVAECIHVMRDKCRNAERRYTYSKTRGLYSPPPFSDLLLLRSQHKLLFLTLLD